MARYGTYGRGRGRCRKRGEREYRSHFDLGEFSLEAFWGVGTILTHGNRGVAPPPELVFVVPVVVVCNRATVRQCHDATKDDPTEEGKHERQERCSPTSRARNHYLFVKHRLDDSRGKGQASRHSRHDFFSLTILCMYGHHI